MYVWLAHSGEYGWTRYGCHSWSWSDNKGKCCFPCTRSRLKNWFRGTSSAAFHESVYIYTVNRYWVSPKFIGSRYCMPMAFTTRSPRAQCLEYTVIYDVVYKKKQNTKLRFELSTDSSIRAR